MSGLHHIALIAIALVSAPLAAFAQATPIEFDVKPKVCTLAAGDDICETTVRAHWRTAHDESLCLVIVGRPEIKRCWEHYSEGSYHVELEFNQDLVVQLRDPRLEGVLASAAITIIREVLQLRRKRRQPWNILY